MTIEVVALSKVLEIVIFNDGQSAPITDWFYDDGESLYPFDGAVRAVAGPDAKGNWHSIDLSDFELAAIH